MVAKFHAVKPHPLNDKGMSSSLRGSTKAFSEFVVKDHKKVTAPWSGEKPDWVVRYWANQYQIGFQVYPSNEDSKGALKWLWIDLGTKAHEIRAKNGGVLAFPSQHQAGSRPGSLFTSKASSGGDMVFTPAVQHPGTEARGWSKMLQELEQPLFEKWMEPAMAKAAKASGHAMEK